MASAGLFQQKIRQKGVRLIPDFDAFAAANPWVGSKVGAVQDLPSGGYEQQFQNATAYGWAFGQPYEVHGAIRDKFNALGGPGGLLGYPTTNETGTPDGKGRFNHFTNGSIYYHPAIGAFEVHGAIHAEWASLGSEAYGYPLTDETGSADGVGRFNHFRTFLPDGTTADASIYWTPGTGAHEVRGAIRVAWAGLGFEKSFLGYPVSDEHDSGGGRRSDFQNGSIFWTAAGGAQVQPQFFIVNAPSITFGSGISVGGSGCLTGFSDGTVHFTGHLHDSGFPSYDCLAVFAIKDADGRAYAASHSGHVSGTDELVGEDRRNLDWDDWGTNQLLQQNWSRIRAGATGGGKVDVTSDWSAQKIGEDVAAVVGVILSVIGLILGGGPANKSSNPNYNPEVNQEQVYPPI